MSDKRRPATIGRGTPVDAVERAASEDLDTRPRMPLLMAPATALRSQAIRLGDGSAGVAVELSNTVVSSTFPMDVRQARAHIDDVERCIVEAQGIPVENLS